MVSVKVTHNWSAIVLRGGIFLLIWWVLADGAAMSWWIGVPMVLLASAASTALQPPQPFAWFAFLRFIPFFLIRSLLGGVDVAWRAFHPSMPIAPDLIEYQTQLPPGLPQVFMANTISLLPGTLSATLDRGVLKIHVLDSRDDFLGEIVAVEHRVARVFNTSLQPSQGNK